MPLYIQKTKDGFGLVQETPLKLEKELQNLTEKNLKEIFGFDFVASEFQHNGLRIDTLAYDTNLNTFVVIEYKREKNFSVIDQGFAYLSLILNNQAEFVLEFNKKFQEKKGKSDFDWSQMKVLFLTRSFTTYQLEAINFRDLPIELWEVTQYEGGLIQYSQIKRAGAKASIETLGISDNEVRKISKEVKSYSEEEYLDSRPDGNGKKLYAQLKDRLSVLESSIILHPTKSYIAFQLPNNWRNIFNCHISKNKVRVDFLRSELKDFKDPERKLIYSENSMRFFNQHISYIDMENENELEYAMYLIQQAYNKFVKEN